MARSLRVEYPGAVYHAMCRGNDGQAIFRSDDGRLLWLKTLSEVVEQTGWLIHAYVLMSNHYHLLLETPEANLVAGMKWFQGTYTQRFNAMFSCRGHLFQGRYKALPIQVSSNPEYFRTVSTYIHLNPFRAGLCGQGLKHPLESYRWSSYPEYIGKSRRRTPWLERAKVLGSWGLEEGVRGTLRSYRNRLEGVMAGETDSALSDGAMKQLKRGWFVGSEEFRERLVEKLSRPGDNLRGGQRRAHSRSAAERYLREGLEVLGITEEALLKMKGNQPEKRAMAWLLKTKTTVTVTWIAERLQMGQRTNASRNISSFARSTKRTDRALRTQIAQVTG